MSTTLDVLEVQLSGLAVSEGVVYAQAVVLNPVTHQAVPYFRIDQSATALEKADPSTPEVVPSLIATLDDSYAEVVGRAAHTLGKFGPDARSAIPALTHAILKNTSGPESYHGASLVDPLRAIGADMAALVAFLEEALNNGDAQVRERAAGALAEIGAEGLPALANALTVPGLLEENELLGELSRFEYPLDTTPELSPVELQALIGHYISERDQQAASTPEEPERWADEQDALLYLATLEREQKTSALAVAHDATKDEKFSLPPTLLAFVVPGLVVLVLLVLKFHR